MLLSSLLSLLFQLYLLENSHVESLSDAEYSKLTSVCASFFLFVLVNRHVLPLLGCFPACTYNFLV